MGKLFKVRVDIDGKAFNSVDSIQTFIEKEVANGKDSAIVYSSKYGSISSIDVISIEFKTEMNYDEAEFVLEITYMCS